eukprot:sb/3469269/
MRLNCNSHCTVCVFDSRTQAPPIYTASIVMTIEYKKMSKTNEKLEWGRYAEYLNFKFVFDFDQLGQLLLDGGGSSIVMTIEYKKMSKTNEKLEWGRYAEYLNFKFVFDFDQLEKGEHKHLSAVTATVTKTLLVGAISAYFSAKIALLQWASISIIVAVIQGLTILNTPSYETSSMKVTSILFSIAFGCTVSSILNNSLGINTWSREESKGIKMCSVLALVGVDTHEKSLSHLVN